MDVGSIWGGFWSPICGFFLILGFCVLCGPCCTKPTFWVARSDHFGHFFGDFCGGRFWTSFVCVFCDFWDPSGPPLWSCGCFFGLRFSAHFGVRFGAGRGGGRPVSRRRPLMWERGKTALGPRDGGETCMGAYFPDLRFPALLKGVLLSHFSDLRHHFLFWRSGGTNQSF